MRKVFWFTLALGLLVAFVAQSHYNYECNLMGAQAADITVRGVMCWYELGGYRNFVSLEKLQAREESRRETEECLKRNPEAKVKCDPRYRPPEPTPWNFPKTNRTPDNHVHYAQTGMTTYKYQRPGL